MVRLVEYRIISGPVIEIRRCRMAVGAQPGRRRAPRKAGASSLKKIMQNEKAAVQRLARIINANFGAGDLWLTLKYSDARLPVTKEEAKRKFRNSYAIWGGHTRKQPAGSSGTFAAHPTPRQRRETESGCTITLSWTEPHTSCCAATGRRRR